MKNVQWSYIALVGLALVGAIVSAALKQTELAASLGGVVLLLLPSPMKGPLK